MNQQKEVVLCYPVRTALGTYGGSLKDIPTADLGAIVIRETLTRAGLAADQAQTLVMGNVIQAGGKMNPARQAGIQACLRELGFAEDVVNVEGGAIAHGHPIGATGAVLATRLLHSMRRDGLKRGVVTLCIGGGQGIALVVESL